MVAAAVAIAAWPAHAQQGKKDLDEMKRQAVEDAYKATMERSKSTTPKPTVDPWGVVFILVEKSRPERPYFAQWG